MGRRPMPHSYTSIMVHVVFSTKDRKAQLDTALEERLYPYLGGILRELGGTLFTANVSLSPATQARFMKRIVHPAEAGCY